ncbi:hypothetical protein [Paraburkholderia sediminicola]|uniref:hypothetical protein n=1 Tax=Paraburkholderia sediminicola TaxID=458836 RepID=UPI0038B7F982
MFAPDVYYHPQRTEFLKSICFDLDRRGSVVWRVIICQIDDVRKSNQDTGWGAFPSFAHTFAIGGQVGLVCIFPVSLDKDASKRIALFR